MSVGIMKTRDLRVVSLSRKAVVLLKGLIPEKSKPDNLVIPESDGNNALGLSKINASLRYI